MIPPGLVGVWIMPCSGEFSSWLSRATIMAGNRRNWSAGGRVPVVVGSSSWMSLLVPRTPSAQLKRPFVFVGEAAQVFGLIGAIDQVVP
jgi:hypothetical protein